MFPAAQWISIRVVAEVALVVVAALYDYRLWSAQSRQRAEGRLADRIHWAGVPRTDREVETEGIPACQALIAAVPQSVAGRLYLGVFHLQLRNYAAARSAFDEAAGLPNVTREERAVAYIGAGVCAFRMKPESQRAQAADEAAECFRRAAVLGSAEAKVSLASVVLWQRGAESADEALDLLKEAAAAKTTPGIAGTTQLHNCRGVALALRNRLMEAVIEFENALALDPGSAEIRQNLTRAEQLRSGRIRLGPESGRTPLPLPPL